MTEGATRSLSVYLATAVFLMWPLLALSIAWAEITRSPLEFALVTVLLLPCFFIIRWDLIAYWLRYLFLAAFALISYKAGGSFGLLLSATSFFLLWCFFRYPGRQKSLNLQFPLRCGVFYVAQGGTFQLLNQHHRSKAQRYALDIVRLNSLGLRARGIYPTRLEAYEIFGNVICSPCTGSVIATMNELQDLTPPELDKTNAAGNHVIIRIGEMGIDVILAHLMKGSVRVHTGDRVVPGQPIANVGNSGNTSEPHLHIHAKRGGCSVLDGEAVPMRFAGSWLVRNSLVRTNR